MGMPMGKKYNDVQMNPDVIENMFGMDPGRQMAFGVANEGFGYTVIYYYYTLVYLLLHTLKIYF